MDIRDCDKMETDLTCLLFCFVNNQNYRSWVIDLVNEFLWCYVGCQT